VQLADIATTPATLPFSHSRSLLHTSHEVRAATQHRYSNNTRSTAIFRDNLVFIGARTMEVVVTISYKMLKAPFKLSPPTNQLPSYYRPDALPFAQPIVSNHLTDNTRKVK